MAIKGFAAARMYDLDLVHCSLPRRAMGSKNVFVNGRSWNRMGDFNFPHLLPCGTFCCIHAAPIAKGSSKVFVNGRGAGSVLDYILTCTFVAKGSPNVYISK